MSKVLERKFVKLTQISKHLTCSICTDVFNEATRLFCGHTYCKYCIEEWAKNNDSCPVCRTKIDRPNLGKDLIAEKIIQDLEVYCINKLCDWKGKLSDLKKHVRGCPMAKPPEWLTQFQTANSFEDPNEPKDLALIGNEEYEERINEEVSKKSLAERLYTKSRESKELLTTVFQPEQPPKKGRGKKKETEKAPIKQTGSMEFYDSIFKTLESDEDDEEKKSDIVGNEGTDSQGINSNSKFHSEGKASLQSITSTSTKIAENEASEESGNKVKKGRKTGRKGVPIENEDNTKKVKTK